MDIDFDKIREENIIEYGAGVRHLSFLGRLYADKTHFIFELLQNAEDAKANKMKFSLYPDRLEVLHNGKSFNEDPEKDDVRGICGIDESTKTDDLTQIGKFGIGFKSVYAYTQTPEIHCQGINFKIEHFVRPYKIKERKISSGWTTLFIFPFASAEADDLSAFQKKASEQISNRLQKLSVRTLLFLRNLEEIEYKTETGISGYYWRNVESEEKIQRRVTVLGQQSEEEIEEEKWIVFSKPISENGSNLNVEIAFKIEQNKNNEITISRLKQSCLNVFFPTEKESHLGFLVQGPYRTTPARDNIPRDDDWNRKLVKDTATLLQCSLTVLKKEGLINVNFLETLPLRTDDYSEDWMFWPIYEATKKAFIDNPLLPTADNDFVTAANAILARGKGLRALLDNNQLSDIFESNSPLKWLSGEITQDRAPILRQYLIYDLDIEEIDPENFARKVTYSFLKKQSDDWHIKFYDFLRGQEAIWRKGQYHFYDGTLRKKPIIRCQDGDNYPAYSSEGRPLVFLPVSSEMNFQTVAPNIYANEKAKLFLENFGLVKPDICAKVLNKILPSFEKKEMIDEFDLELYQKSLNLIDDATLLNDSPLFTKLIKQLKAVPWILAKNQSGDHQYKLASDVYISSEELYITTATYKVIDRTIFF